jgi:hypothetical protein
MGWVSLATTKERTTDDQMTHRDRSEKVVAQQVGDLGHHKGDDKS